MGLFDRFRQPTWVRLMPSALRPPPQEIRALEEVRKRVGASHVEFEMHITSHWATTQRLLLKQCQLVRAQRPDAPLQDVLATVLVLRHATGGYALGINDALGADAAFRLAQIAVSGFACPEEFAKEVATSEAMFDRNQVPGNPEFQWAETEISRILAGRH